MGELIDLRLRPARTGQPPARPSDPCSATILLFTGVRYQRTAEPDTARETPPDPKKPRGRRRA